MSLRQGETCTDEAAFPFVPALPLQRTGLSPGSGVAASSLSTARGAGLRFVSSAPCAAPCATTSVSPSEVTAF